MTETLCTSGAMLLKAGIGRQVNISGQGIIEFQRQAESFVNASTRFNWNDVYTTLDNDVKFILEDACSSEGAIKVILFDMSGYDSLSEAETMINVLRDNVNRSIKLLEDIKNRDFVTGA